MFEESHDEDFETNENNDQVQAEKEVFKLIQFASALPKDDLFCKALISRFLTPKEDTTAELGDLISLMMSR